MEQETTDTSKLCNEASSKKVIEYAEEAYRLSEREEYKPLYEDGNFLELANPDEPHTSKMIAAMLNYKQNGDFVLFKSFVRRFLSPIGLKEEWIKNPDIWPEKDCMDIRVLDDKYAILFESKLKEAGFQRNQLGRYINKLNDKQENGKKYNEDSIFIVLIPGHISNDFISEIPESVWRRPQDIASPICAINGNQTTCWCDAEKTIEKCKDAQCDKCTEYLQSYLPHTIVIDEQLAEWILSAVGLVESRQTLLISSMTLFADYIKKLYNINYPNKLIMAITEVLNEKLFKNASSIEEKIKIIEQVSIGNKLVNESLKSMNVDLHLEKWQSNLKKKWSMLHPSINKANGCKGYCITIKKDEKDTGVEIGFWDGKDNAKYDYIPYWGAYCVNGKEPKPEQTKWVMDIVNSLGIQLAKTGREQDEENGWIAWNNWIVGEQDLDEICDDIYEKAKEKCYLFE